MNAWDSKTDHENAQVKMELEPELPPNQAMATNSKLKKVYADLWGPHQPCLLSKKTYAATLICKHTRKSWVLVLPSKDAFVEAFQDWVPQVESKAGCKLQSLRADGRGEFISIKLQNWCAGRGIKIKYAAPYMHEENGIAERGWKTIATMKNSLLLNSVLPNDFWAETMDTASYLRNRLLTRSQKGEVISKESWTGRKQDLAHIRVFGSVAHVGIAKKKRGLNRIRMMRFMAI